MKRNVEVVSYDLKWQELFESEAELIKKALGSNCLEIHHIGSTSVPGLSAKPVIDIMPVVSDILEVDKAIKAMESLGYEAKGEAGMAFRRYFPKNIGEIRTHNVHVYEKGDLEIDRYLAFRNWLRIHDDDAKAYGHLKIELAEKYPQDILSYCMGKDAFVATIDEKDGYDGWRMVQALTDREWAAVRSFRGKCFFKEKDPYSGTLDHKNHVHFVFYKKAEIIGYAHLQLWQEDRVALRLLFIDENYRNRRLGKQLLELSERWLIHQGFKKLLMKSSKESFSFFQNLGYVKMPFNDPEDFRGDSLAVEIGKDLSVNKKKNIPWREAAKKELAKHSEGG